MSDDLVHPLLVIVIELCVGSAIGYWLYKSKVRRLHQFFIICGVMVNLILVFGLVKFARKIGWTQKLSEDWHRWYFLIFFSGTMTMLATLATWIALLLKIHYLLKFCLPSSPAERRRQVVKWRPED